MIVWTLSQKIRFNVVWTISTFHLIPWQIILIKHMALHSIKNTINLFVLEEYLVSHCWILLYWNIPILSMLSSKVTSELRYVCKFFFKEKSLFSQWRLSLLVRENNQLKIVHVHAHTLIFVHLIKFFFFPRCC